MSRQVKVLRNLALVAFGALLCGHALGATGDAPAADANVMGIFVALAVAIERFWETAFALFENFVTSTQRVLGSGAQFAGWARAQIDSAGQAVSAAAAALPGKPQDAPEWTAFRDAEQRLLAARARVGDGLKSPGYVCAKRAITLVGSLAIGLGVAIGARLCFLAKAGIAAPEPVDWVLTGLIVGAGPGPLHSLIGVIQETRKSLAGLADLTRGGGLRAAAQAVREASDDAAGHRIATDALRR